MATGNGTPRRRDARTEAREQAVMLLYEAEQRSVPVAVLGTKSLYALVPADVLKLCSLKLPSRAGAGAFCSNGVMRLNAPSADSAFVDMRVNRWAESQCLVEGIFKGVHYVRGHPQVPRSGPGRGNGCLRHKLLHCTRIAARIMPRQP